MANSKRRCMHCKEYFLVETMRKTPKGWFCTIEHALQYANKETRARIERADRAKHKADKERVKTRAQWMKEAQAAFNSFVRARDYGKPCVSCGALPAQKYGGTMDCGHFRSTGSASHLRFNLFNTASQCVTCNRYGSGMAVDYRIELIKRIGLDRVERLESNNTPRSFDIDYLKRIKRIFNKRAKYYKKRRGIA